MAATFAILFRLKNILLCAKMIEAVSTMSIVRRIIV